jgi:hypothetical protein
VIEWQVFYRCDPTPIDVPTKVEKIAERCLGMCHSLKSVVFPSKTWRLEAAAFIESGFDCSDIPASVEVIGENCFQNNRTVKSVRFNSSSKLLRIEAYAFSGGPLVKQRLFYLRGGLRGWSSISNQLFIASGSLSL